MFISDLITGVWDFRNPKPREKEWLEFFIGKEGTNRIIIRALDMKKAKHGMTTDEFKDWLKWWKSALKQSEEDAKKMVTDLIKKHKLIIKEYPYSNELLKDTFSSINKK